MEGLVNTYIINVLIQHYIFIDIISLHAIFSHQHYLGVFLCSQSEGKCTPVPRTLLSILADLINVIIWMVSILPLIFKSSNSFSKLLEVILSPPKQLELPPPARSTVFFLVLKLGPSICLAFHLLFFSICGPSERQNP